MLVHWYNKFHDKRLAQTSLFLVHGPFTIGLKWSGCSPTISGVCLNWLPHWGVKPDLQTLSGLQHDFTHGEMNTVIWYCQGLKVQCLACKRIVSLLYKQVELPTLKHGETITNKCPKYRLYTTGITCGNGSDVRYWGTLTDETIKCKVKKDTNIMQWTCHATAQE